MDVQVLYLQDCPGWRTAVERLRAAAVSARSGPPPIDTPPMNADAGDTRPEFFGSPTILVDGQSLLPVSTASAAATCRLDAIQKRRLGHPRLRFLCTTLGNEQTMTSLAPDTDRLADVPYCGCCGRTLPAGRLTELGSTPGVFICASCALWAARRATRFPVVRLDPRLAVRWLARQVARDTRTATMAAPILPTTDLDRTASYYQSLGLKVTDRTDTYLVMNLGPVEMHFTEPIPEPGSRAGVRACSRCREALEAAQGCRHRRPRTRPRSAVRNAGVCRHRSRQQPHPRREPNAQGLSSHSVPRESGFTASAFGIERVPDDAARDRALLAPERPARLAQAATVKTPAPPGRIRDKSADQPSANRRKLRGWPLRGFAQVHRQGNQADTHSVNLCRQLKECRHY